MPTATNVDQLCVSALRFLAVDAVEAAKSGHPGLPLGAAPMAYVLFDRIMRHNPANPHWANRDRFVLSAGHGSALLYALLHCYGYGLPLDEVKRFRQLGSLTPGHPEYGHTAGVEATTGPLGAGFSMGVGMALAERLLAHRYGEDVVDHHTYAIVSDGDLMEGISSEAASLAGHLQLGKLIYLYDDNEISLDGPTALSFTEDRVARFAAYNWHVQKVSDGNDLEAIEAAIRAAQKDPRPSLIQVRTHIGFGSPVQDSQKAHGAPLGPDNTKATKEKLGWPTEPAFYVPQEATDHFAKALEKGAMAEKGWDAVWQVWSGRNAELATEFATMLAHELPKDWDAGLNALDFGDKPIATRVAGSKVINALAPYLPMLVGGAADLSESTKTNVDASKDYQPEQQEGRNLYFGVREHAMGGAVNGLALHDFIAYSATFLVFSDYMRGALRLGALMNLRSIYVFTHDSICVGEDGPTHEPVEHVAALRLIPNMTVFRPADAYETAECWRAAIKLGGPCCMILCRQNLPVMGEQKPLISQGVSKGAYVLRESTGDAKVSLLATGSEVHLALTAAEQLERQGVPTRVVSMPSIDLFEQQDKTHQQSVLKPGVPRVSIEAGTTKGWREWVGDTGATIGIDRFGLSAPGDTVYAELGFTVENVVKVALQVATK